MFSCFLLGTFFAKLHNDQGRYGYGNQGYPNFDFLIHLV